MNLNDEYLLKVYLQCGDFENFKDTYLKIKRNFSNIVKKKDFGFNNLLCKYANKEIYDFLQKNEKSSLKNIDMLSLDCLSEMVANSNIDLFDHLLNTHNKNEKIGNLYKYINNIDYNYKAKSVFIQMLVSKIGYQQNLTLSHEDKLNLETKLKHFLEDNPNDIHTMIYDKYLKFMQNGYFDKNFLIYTDKNILILPDLSKINLRNNEEFSNFFTENLLNETEKSIKFKFNDLEFKFLRVNQALLRMFDFPKFSISDHSFCAQNEFNRFSALHLKSINNILIDNLLNKV